MAFEKRIEALKQKHARLDQLLRAEETRFSADDLELHRLKTQKLALKDEIEQLLHGHRVAA